jgi:hypothetical protein
VVVSGETFAEEEGFSLSDNYFQVYHMKWFHSKLIVMRKSIKI